MKRYYLLSAILIILIPTFGFWLSCHLPLSWAYSINGLKVEPTYIPFEHQKPYASVFGKRIRSGYKIIYEGSQQQLVFRVTNITSDIKDPKWNKDDSILNGSKYHFEVTDTKQIFEWMNEENRLQFKLTYTGGMPLSQNEFVKIAESVRIDDYYR